MISIIIPTYNEEKTISKILKRIDKINFADKKEIIIVDDFSSDKTRKILSDQKKKIPNLRIFYHKKNFGKGAAIKTGLKKARGGIIAIQDADLEYDPKDLVKLIKTLKKENLKVIYGSRFLDSGKKGKLKCYLGNKIISLLTSFLYSTKITDMETCYKVFKKETIKNIKIKSNRFDFEPEITSKLLRKGYKIKELPISYNPRTAQQGKKIKTKDGLIAVKCLIKYRFLD